MQPVLEVRELRVQLTKDKRTFQAVRGVSFSIGRKEVVAIVGESGSGKSITAKALLQLLPTASGKITEGSIKLNGQELVGKTRKEMEKIRGCRISMIFQDPMTALNPTMPIGKQIMEVLMLHQRLSRLEAKKRAIDLLKQVAIPNPERRMKEYPHQLSGGMRQRVMIAIALGCHPELLIADEPTTALDPTIQAQILQLLQELKEKFEMAVLLITHDLGVVAEIADRVLVMYAGQIVESGTVDDLFYAARHPYTQGLLRSLPRLDGEERKELQVIEGTPPQLDQPVAGCAFVDRCPHAMMICERQVPILEQVQPGHHAACWLLDKRAVLYA